MAAFPKDAPKSRVLKALALLGIRVVREHEHIAMARQRRWYADAVDHAQSPEDQRFHVADDLYASRNCTKRLLDRFQGVVRRTNP